MLYTCIVSILQAIPKYTVSSSAIEQNGDILKGKNVYVQEKLSKRVAAGTSFLYCKYNNMKKVAV